MILFWETEGLRLLCGDGEGKDASDGGRGDKGNGCGAAAAAGDDFSNEAEEAEERAHSGAATGG